VSGGAADADRVRLLRDVLTATGAVIYLATHVAGPLPAETMAAVHESDDLELRIGRVGPDRAEDLEQRGWEARAAVAAAIKAPFERVLLAHGTAEAVRAVCLEALGGHVAGRRDDGDDPVTVEPPRVIVLDGLPDVAVEAIAGVVRAVGGRLDHETKLPEILGRDVSLVAMPHVDPLGRLSDPQAVATVAHRAGARLLVDVSLSVGALPVEVSDLGADVIVGDVHRWLLGPEGVAFAWLGPSFAADAVDRLAAATGPFGRGPLLALARSVGWLLMYVDLAWVVARTSRLARRLYGSLASVDGVDLVSGRSSHGPILAFRIAGWDPEQAADELSRSAFVIADVDAGREAVRVSVGAWNREDELDRFVERVAEMASHTPATLPRRPSLTIISGPLDRR
jgi:selenocysteine lyase/cysteine desulfurase